MSGKSKESKKRKLLEQTSPKDVKDFCTDTSDNSKKEYRGLKLREAALDKEIAILLAEMTAESDAKSYMNQLHVYNDVKDVTQIVLGSLARLEDVSVTELHEQFGLSYKDNDA